MDYVNIKFDPIWSDKFKGIKATEFYVPICPGKEDKTKLNYYEQLIEYYNKEISRVLLNGEPGYNYWPDKMVEYNSRDAEFSLKLTELTETKMTTFEKYKDLFAGEVSPNIKKVFAILCDEIDSLKDKVNELAQSMEEGSELEYVVKKPIEEAFKENLNKFVKATSDLAELVGPSSKCNLGDCQISAPDIEFRKELPPDDLIIAHEKNGGRWESTQANTQLRLRVLNGVLGLTWNEEWHEFSSNNILRDIWKIHSYRPIDSENKPVGWNSLVMS